MDISTPPPLTVLNDRLFIEKEVSVSVLRLDLIHQFINGNKWFKLKYNLEEFFRRKKKYIVTFGGAFSNHIIATAAAGKEFGIKTIGIIRGDELNENSNRALKFAAQSGMQLFFISRKEYRQMRNSGFLIERICHELNITGDDIYIIPEGGSNVFAVRGCAEIVSYIGGDFDIICCPCGTGATLAGISTALNKSQKAIGVSVLGGEKFLAEDILKLNGVRNNFELFHGYSFGGYSKSNTILDSFCETFFKKHLIRIEPIYTGKLFFGIYDLASKDFFTKGDRIIAVHSGGVY